MIEKEGVLEAVLKSMVETDVTITARAAARQTDGVLKHASDITRNTKRKELLDRYSNLQRRIRDAVDRSSKKSRSELERLVAKKDAEIDRLKSEQQLLIASHRAMILSVTEMGGFSTWKRFFEKYQSCIENLERMHSLPEAEVFPLNSTETR